MGLVGLLAAAVLAAPLSAEPVPAAHAESAWSGRRDNVRVESLGRLFPFLDLYYRLDPTKRTRFDIAYRLHSGERGAQVRVTLLDAVQTPLALSNTGWFERAPTPEELARKFAVRVESPVGSRFGVSLVPEVRLHPQNTIDAAEIVAAMDQFEIGVHGAGPLGVLIPHFRHVQFHGGEGARVIDLNGDVTPAPLRHGQPFLTLQALRRARSIVFDVAPERVLILPE